MKKITSLLLLVSSFTGFAQKTNLAISGYSVLTGRIDKYPVTFHVYRINNELSGHYYYDNTCLPISLNGTLGKDGFLKLTNTAADEKDNEVFEGIYKDSAFSGTWTSKGKLLPFRVSRKKDNNELQFDYITASGEKKMTVKPEFGPDELSFDAATIWPSAKWQGPLADSLRQFIRTIFGEKNSSDEIGKILLRRKKEILEPEKDAPDEIQVYSTSNVVHVEYASQQLLAISQMSYGYYGGAHGNYGTSYTCFNLANNSMLKLADVLDTIAAKGVIEKVLENKFRASYSSIIAEKDKLSEVLFEEQIPMNDNFLVTAKGIGFNYMPYEIAAYAFGEIFLYIPFKEIDTLLKPEFKKLVNL